MDVEGVCQGEIGEAAGESGGVSRTAKPQLKQVIHKAPQKSYHINRRAKRLMTRVANFFCGLRHRGPIAFFSLRTSILCAVFFLCGDLFQFALSINGQNLLMNGLCSRKLNGHSYHSFDSDSSVGPPKMGTGVTSPTTGNEPSSKDVDQYSAFGVPTCRGLVPAYDRRFPVSRRPITRLEDLRESKERLMVVAPMFGLGNTLRGYCSAFVYSVLTGRKIVLLHLGPHGQVWDGLCTAFQCSFDKVVGIGPGEKLALWEYFTRHYKYVQVHDNEQSDLFLNGALSLEETVALSYSREFYDNYWIPSQGDHEGGQEDDSNGKTLQMSRCVLDVFNCSNHLCVYSRAVKALTRGPSQLLMDSLRDVVESGARLRGVFPDKFDFAIHVRTLTPAVEHAFSENAKCINDGCRKRMAAMKDIEARFTDPARWSCIGKEMMSVQPDRKGNYSIFLATDDEKLRPKFVEILSEYGAVYYSASPVAHTSKSKSSIMALLSTMAEFYLLGRATSVLTADPRFSTFAFFASLNGITDSYRELMGGDRCGYMQEDVRY